VYDIYADDLTEYYAARTNARNSLIAQGVPQSAWPSELQSHPSSATSSQMSENPPRDHMEGAMVQVRKEIDDEIEQIEDPAMKQFLMMERALRRKKRDKMEGLGINS